MTTITLGLAMAGFAGFFAALVVLMVRNATKQEHEYEGKVWRVSRRTLPKARRARW